MARLTKRTRPTVTSSDHRRVRVRPPRAPRRWVRRLAVWSAIVGIWLVIGLAGLVAWYAADLPDLDEALAPTRRPAITVLARDGTEMATHGDYYGRALAVAELPPAMPLAMLATEDRRFYRHFGLDPIGIARAAFANLRAGSVVQGGSTITQQVAKNLFLNSDRTLKRKVQELLLAFWLEYRFEKDQILAIYLNRAYFGAGAYGVDAAARKFFGRPATKISTYQAAMLAGLVKAPSRYNPLANPELAAGRASAVLGLMVDAGYLSPEEAQTALIDGSAVTVTRRRPVVGPYFVDWVIAQLPAFVAAGDQDLVVETTLDVGIQKAAASRLNGILDGKAATAGRASQGAVVVMSPDGAVRAMVGGRDHSDSPFNRAAQARRQPGSAFKPIVYLAGLEAGLTPDSHFHDTPIQVAGWRPQNFAGKYQGEVTLRTALARSINTVAVQVGEYAGPERVIDAARRLGLTGDMLPTPSLALGVNEVSLTELTAAYAAFANGGQGVWAYGVEAIRDPQGRILYRRSGSGPGRAMSSRHAAEITDMLSETVASGTGRTARFDHPAAGKTGTSDDHRDAWFVGFTADLVAGVWVGNDDNRPMKGVTGGGVPAQVWRAVMADVHAGRPPRPLPSLAVPIARSETPPEASRTTPPAVQTRRNAANEATFWDRLMRVFGG